MKRRFNPLMETSFIQNARDARRALARIGAESQECVLALFLDSRNRLLGRREIFRGTADMSMARPREILREALIAGATRLVVGHNHPSGDPEPSEEDVRFTVRMEWAAEAVGVPLVDHLIICRGGKYFSFAEAMLLGQCRDSAQEPSETSSTPAFPSPDGPGPTA